MKYLLMIVLLCTVTLKKDINYSQYSYMEGNYSGIWRSSVAGTIGEASLNLKIQDESIVGVVSVERDPDYPYADYPGENIKGYIKSVNKAGITIEIFGESYGIIMLMVYKDASLRGNYTLRTEGKEDRGTFEFYK